MIVACIVIDIATIPATIVPGTRTQSAVGSTGK